MNFIMTNDVECHSFETNSLDESIPKRVEKEAMPELLALYRKYSVKATFFFTAQFARLSPKTVLMVKKEGHEIACHGYNHRDYYDVMNYKEQFKILEKSKKIIEDISETEVVSFRAPALRINKYTVRALENTGFKYDSSVASQRFDGPFTSGAFKKLGWILAPRKPYYLSYTNPFKKGQSSILELPISALIWPFIGTHMRLNPFITKQIQKLLMKESKITRKPLVFLFHPNECLEFKKKSTIRRGNWFCDNIRHGLKMKNLGKNSLKLLELVIKMAKKNNFNFFTVNAYKSVI